MKKLTFLQKEEVKVTIGQIIAENLERNRMPFIMLSWNPADPSDIAIWHDQGLTVDYKRSMLQLALDNIK